MALLAPAAPAAVLLAHRPEVQAEVAAAGVRVAAVAQAAVKKAEAPRCSFRACLW